MAVFRRTPLAAPETSRAFARDSRAAAAERLAARPAPRTIIAGGAAGRGETPKTFRRGAAHGLIVRDHQPAAGIQFKESLLGTPPVKNGWRRPAGG